MDLHNFPMDKQSCPLIFGSYGYPNDQLIYSWDEKPVTFSQQDFTLSQFDIVKTIFRNRTFLFRRGNYSMLQLNFNLRRHVGYFLIQVYVPCLLIVVLSAVGFWINREATADRIGLGATAVLTLTTGPIIDSRSDLPRVSYATALDWYTIMCFLFVVFTLLEFAGVHYFTKIGTGEMPFIEIDEDWNRSSSENEDSETDDDREQENIQRSKSNLSENAQNFCILSSTKRYGRKVFDRTRKKQFKKKLEDNKKNPCYISKNYFDYTTPQQKSSFSLKNFHYCQQQPRSKIYHQNLDFVPNIYKYEHKPDCSQYYQQCRNDSMLPVQQNNKHKVLYNDLNHSQQQMSYLESYINHRLMNSNISLMYPTIKDDTTLPEIEAENNFFKLNLSCPNLAWTEIEKPTLNNFNADDAEDEEKFEIDDSYFNKFIFKFKMFFVLTLLCCVEFWYCFTSNEKYKKAMLKRRNKNEQNISGVNSVSMIDKVSRILFPFIFLMLNIIYWWFYINERNSDFSQWE